MLCGWDVDWDFDCYLAAVVFHFFIGLGVKT